MLSFPEIVVAAAAVADRQVAVGPILQFGWASEWTLWGRHAVLPLLVEPNLHVVKHRPVVCSLVPALREL